MIEARCMVCGAPLGESMSHIIDAKHGKCLPEVCSQECYEIYYEETDFEISLQEDQE